MKRDERGQFSRHRAFPPGPSLGAAVASRENRVKAPLLPASRSSRTPGRINLKAVAEVLAARGLDPTEEIINILRPVDENGNPTACMLDHDVQARVLNELLQYTQPKLKSIEVRAKVAATSFDINDVQARRIAEEFLIANTEVKELP